MRLDTTLRLCCILLFSVLLMVVLSIPLLLHCKDAFDLGRGCLKDHLLAGAFFLVLVQLTFAFHALEKVLSQ
jgi:hypothetical protein